MTTETPYPNKKLCGKHMTFVNRSDDVYTNKKISLRQSLLSERSLRDDWRFDDINFCVYI